MRFLGILLFNVGVAFVLAAHLPMPRVLGGVSSEVSPERRAEVEKRIKAAEEATQFMLLSESLQRTSYFALRDQVRTLEPDARKADQGEPGGGDELVFLLSLKKFDDQVAAFVTERDSWRLKLDIGGGVLVVGGIAAFVVGRRKARAKASPV